MAGGLADIANTAGLRGDYLKAERLMREAIAMRIRLHGPEHHLVYRYRAHRAMYLSRLGRQAEAEHEVTAALAALEAELASEHEHVRYAREAQAEVARRHQGFGSSRSPDVAMPPDE